MKWISAALILGMGFLVQFANADIADDIAFKCQGHSMVADSTSTVILERKPKIDKAIWGADLGDYTFIADTYFLPKAVNISIHNRKTGRSTSSYVGFVELEGSSTSTATLTFYENGADESQIVMQLTCMRDVTIK